MRTEMLDQALIDDQDTLLIKVPLRVMGLSLVYAAALSLLERKYPIKPDHTWAEVTGGVMVSLMPVALAARKRTNLDWRTYEHAIWRSFLASGTPIIIWQLGEAILRHIELLRYTAERETRSIRAYANSTTALADGSRGRAGGGAASGERGDAAAPARPGDA